MHDEPTRDADWSLYPRVDHGVCCMALGVVAGLALLVSLSGCCAIDAAGYVQADQLTHDAMAQEYLGYVDADATLDRAEVARRHRTVESEADRLAEAKEALGE